MNTTAETNDNVIKDILQKHFGFNALYPMQQNVIDHVLNGQDGVVLMPTGGGKSLCYQLPALVFSGLTLVISPLIALMKDQVQSLHANNIPADFYNSTMTNEDKLLVKEKIEGNNIKLLYVAPESLFAGNLLDFLKKQDIALVAIDEAHCVSSWGHHFRPEYKKLAMIKNQFGNPPVIALTATADKAVRSDIGQLLGMENPEYFIDSFDRPNLSIKVLPGQKKWEQIIRIVKKYKDKSGIIYCISRNGTEKLASKLEDHGIHAQSYHAGMSSDARSKVQDDFIQGNIDVICATIAFGMGIDKPDVRFVIHQNLPGNLESYYQEIGRAGRDGLPAETVLFYSYRDVQVHMGFIEDIKNETYKNIQLAKLERMKEYAEAQVCRRRILLSYFSEIPEENCNNCDVCHNPPEYFDGTVLAQKAMSAIARCNERIGVSVLVEVLKGVYSPGVKENRLHEIKTFGAGKDVTAFAWQLYIQQLIQQGVVEVDYRDSYTLKITEYGKDILFNNKTMSLVTYETIKQRLNNKKEVEDGISRASEVDAALLNTLKALRKEIALEVDKPVFIVFSDATLQDMCLIMPETIDEFLLVNGVGEYKASLYGERFISAIKAHESI